MVDLGVSVEWMDIINASTCVYGMLRLVPVRGDAKAPPGAWCCGGALILV